MKFIWYYYLCSNVTEPKSKQRQLKKKKKVQTPNILCDYLNSYMEMISPNLCQDRKIGRLLFFFCIAITGVSST